MNKSAYVCLMVVFKMLGIKADSKKLKSSFENSEDADITIIKAAKLLLGSTIS